MGGPADGRTGGDGAAPVRQSPRPTVRPDRHPPRRRAPRRPDAARFGLRHGAGGPGRRHDPDARRQPDEVRGARLDLCRAGARGEERVASRRDAHASQGHGLRRPGSTGHERSLQGAGGALRHARRGGASAATPQDAARRAAVRGGGAVTPPRVDADTPLMQQYREIKARHPDAILFFRMGDFYEMFEDDAQLAARELGLTLTSRNNGGAAEVPLAGVPVKAATDYLRRLIAQGHRVAICEQVEDPKLAKGLVRREVVETVTPGTVLAEDWLERNRNNFLLALDPRGAGGGGGGNGAGLAALDLTTGELALETVPIEDVESALARYEAPEVVLPAGCRVTLPVGSLTVTEREAWEFDPELARDDLARTFRLASLD